MTDIERSIMNFIKLKEIDYLQPKINLNIQIEDFMFTLNVSVEEEEDDVFKIYVEPVMIKNYNQFVYFTTEFMEELVEHFIFRISNAEEEYFHNKSLSLFLNGEGIDTND